VAFSPQGDLVATAGLDTSIRLWNPVDGSLVRTFDQDIAYCAALAFSPDGQSLAVGCGEPFTAFVLNVADGKHRYSLPGHKQVVTSVAWSPDGSLLVTGCQDASTRFWNATSGELIRSTSASPTATIAAVAFSADGQTIAAASHDGSVEVRNAASGAPELTILSHQAGILSMATSHHGRRLATSGHDQTIRVWNSKSGDATISVAPRIRSVAPSPDGRRLALGNEDGTIDLWDVTAGSKECTLAGSRHWPAALAFSPDNRLLAAGGNGSEPTIRLWEVASRSKVHLIDAHARLMTGLSFSPDAGTLVSSGYDGLIKLWDVGTGQNAAVIKGGNVEIDCLALSTDGRSLATAHRPPMDEPQIRFWDLASRHETNTLTGMWHHIIRLAFGPGDKTLVVGHFGQGVRVWNLTKGTVGELLYGTGLFAVDPHSGFMAVETLSGIELYDPAFSTPVAVLSPGGADLRAEHIFFTPDGRHLAMLASNGTVQILRLPPPNE
jgi:WD40 repeat protein